MRTMTLPSLVALVWLTPCGPLTAAEPEALPAVGTRVRIQAPDVSSKRLIGRLTEVSPDGLSLRVEGQDALVRVPLEAVAKLEVSRGRKSIGKSVLIGATLAAGVGAVTYVAEPSYGSLYTHYPREGALGGAVVGAAVGLVVGALGGERWQTVAPERLRVALAPARRRGVGLAMTVAF